MNDVNDSLLRELVTAIAPPPHPIGFDSAPDLQLLPGFPPDLMMFMRAYGSGCFDVQDSFSLEVLNPWETKYWLKQFRYLNNIRLAKEIEGEDYIPYSVYPDSPGLFLWGTTDKQKDFFWLTEGEPEDWPILVIYDQEVFTRFDCSMLDFLKQLLCGEIDCTFIGGVDTPNNRINPFDCKFEPWILP